LRHYAESRTMPNGTLKVLAGALAEVCDSA
jgi:hypothetical protein